jgi:SAM-dependent methyltransferase
LRGGTVCDGMEGAGVLDMRSRCAPALDRALQRHAPTEHDGFPSPAHIAYALRQGICPTDRAFDVFLLHELRSVSFQYWTPVAVAARAAAWLDDLGVRTVVDIGSGAGKFCVAAALASSADFLGIEHRPRLVAAARALAQVFGVEERVRFEYATFGEVPAPPADAYYLYNPFGENLFDDDQLDDTVELSARRFERDVAATEWLLASAPRGTYLLTYNGFGGQVPDGWREVRVADDLPTTLSLWAKDRTVRRHRGTRAPR